VRAEFWIKHSQIDPKVLSGNLERTFGLDDRDALKNSEVFNAKWQDQVLFCREDPSYRIICFRST
jgi:hypothetical protein